MPLQSRFQSPQNGHRSLMIRLMDHHRTKPSVKRRIFFNKFAVFLHRCGAQHLQLSPTQSRFEDIGRINSAFRCTGAHNGMHFIHEQDHIATSADLCQHIPKPLFKFSSVFGACHQICHIQTDESLFLQLGRYIAHGHPLRQSLRNGRLSHTRFPDQSGIVFILPAQNADHHVDLLLPSNDRFHGLRLLYQIHTELLQQLRSHRLLFSISFRSAFYR